MAPSPGVLYQQPVIDVKRRGAASHRAGFARAARVCDNRRRYVAHLGAMKG
jgi:hypothetical protein